MPSASRTISTDACKPAILSLPSISGWLAPRYQVSAAIIANIAVSRVKPIHFSTLVILFLVPLTFLALTRDYHGLPNREIALRHAAKSNIVIPTRFVNKYLMKFDVAIIGSGLAGLSVALPLAQTRKVAVISKRALLDGASNWAQGGIAAVLDSGD